MIPRTLLKSHNLEQVTLEEGRHYLDVDGNKYTSVTTLLSQLTDSSFLEKWVNRVGVPESERIRGTANKRGTAVHDAVERYLNNDQDYLRDATLIDHDAINKLIEAKPAKNGRRLNGCRITCCRVLRTRLWLKNSTISM